MPVFIVVILQITCTYSYLVLKDRPIMFWIFISIIHYQRAYTFGALMARHFSCLVH
ncbi:hypothetical protein GGR51DRAFT_542009 [Nemania sp. FL0031]|nr:hypothetical protein GGR51DRAFT_542009 [Nemania sp. FL0031]